MPNWEAYAEADRRGILPPDKKALYDEAKKRGLVSVVGEQPTTATDSKIQPNLPPENEPVPKWGRDNPNLYGAYGSAKETGKAIVKPVAQAGAMAGGFLVGGPPGAALGYGIEQQAEKLIEEKMGQRQPQPLMQRMGEASQDVAVGMAGEALGPAMQAVGKGVAGATKPIQKYLYESALKIPPSVPKALRDVAVEKGIKGQYVPNPKGLEKLQKDITAVNNQISHVIDLGTRSGKTVQTSEVLNRLDDLREFYRNTPDPTDYLSQIDDIANNMRSYHGDRIPLTKAQEIKKTIYRLEKKHYGEMKGLQVEANKTIARGLKEEIVRNEPDLARLNADDSAMLNLESVLERAVNRIRNYDVIRWGDTFMTLTGAVVGGTGGAVGAGLTKRILEDAAIKSRIAFALSKAAKVKPRPAATRAAVLTAAEEED